MKSRRTEVKRKKPVTPGLDEYAGLLVKAALAEDIGTGDITTEAIVPRSQAGEAEFLAKEDFIVAGLFVAEKAFKRLDKKAVFKALFKDGDRVKKGQVIAAVSGRLAALLTAERVALNFLQRLSGIATLTGKLAGKIKSENTRLLDTRKTTPCLRLLEKYAVRAGGGYNHRFGLFDCVLIKDNHIAVAGGVKEAIGKVVKKYEGSALIEVEARNLKEVKEAVSSGADIIMLDNMGTDKIKKSLKIIKGSALVEVSGGVSADNIGEIASTGADFISVGALTHSARAVDISMEVVSLCRQKRPQRSK